MFYSTIQKIKNICIGWMASVMNIWKRFTTQAVAFQGAVAGDTG
jgi:hypothetical protein